MPSANLPKTAAPQLPIESFHQDSQAPSSLKAIFVGRDGLRVGWRLLIFAIMIVVLLGSFVVFRHGGPQGFREARERMSHTAPTPFLVGESEGIAFLLVCVATLIMGKIEHRKFSEYGLPLRLAVAKNLWRGWVWGFLAISGTLLTMFLLHGFRITGLALHGTAILSAVMAWGVAFLAVGLCEEFLLRGYFQFTLTSGIGFWPAVFVLSGLFGFSHAFNPGETVVGSIAAGMFGLLYCLFLQRTGTLWCAVGFHAAWDFGQTFYGVPDSAMLPYHSTFYSAFNGPLWLTGGAVGPEASVLTPIALLVVGLIFSRFYRENKYQVLGPRWKPSKVS